MGCKLAIDFGTTNSVVACWDEMAHAAHIVPVPGASVEQVDGRPPTVPSLLYVRNGRAGKVVVGQAVANAGLDRQRDNRLFRNFKRGIVAAPAPGAAQHRWRLLGRS